MKKGLIALALTFWLVLPLSVLLIAGAADAAGPCGAGGTAHDVNGIHLDAEQLGNAATIVGVIQHQTLSARAATISLATAMQESTLHNDQTQRDHDSIGLFQQRVSIYGADVAGDPVRSTSAFLAKLVRIPNWQILPLTEVAADVQNPRADLRGEYAKWEPLAQNLTVQLWAGAVTTCGNGTDDPAASTGGGIPAGYELPSAGQARTAVAFALAQIGKPYVFGAEGPDSYDCSGLMMAAWAAAGVNIPRVTSTQVRFGVAVPGLAALQPGDLIFIPGSDGTTTEPGHVGMYIGVADGKQYLVQAPHTGDVVKVTPVSSWGNQIAAIRRPIDKSPI